MHKVHHMIINLISRVYLDLLIPLTALQFFDMPIIALKVLADPNRLEILDLLSCDELCAHDLLGHFQFSQPTLSHHMKALLDSELITMRKLGNKRR